MSGGSFNYLFAKQVEFPLDDLKAIYEIIKTIAPPNSMAVNRTLEFIEAIESLQEEGDHPLREVWRAVEWYVSNDYGVDQVIEAINEYDGPAL